MTYRGGWGPQTGEGRGSPRRGAARLGAWALAAVVAVATLVLVPARADAHAELVSTEPAASEQLTTAPDEVVLHFTEAVDITDDTVEVLDATGERLDVGEPEHPGGDGAAVSVSLPALDDGAYVVAWRVVSSDSHPIGGAFTFRVGDAGAVAVDDQALIDDVLGGSRDGDTALGAVYGVVRFLGFAGVTVLVGAVAFIVWLWPAGADARRARRVVAGAWLVTAVATVLSIPLQGAYAVGGTLGDALAPEVVADEMGARTGRAWVVRLLVLAAAAVLLPRLRRLADAPARVVAAVGGLVLLVTVSLTGHAVSGDLVPLAFVTDVAHLSGVSVWVGGLTVLVLGLLWRRSAGAGDGGDGRSDGDRGDDVHRGDHPGGRDDIGRVEPVVDRFSQVAFAAVVVIVVSGAVQGWRQVGGYDALFETTYGRLLVIKVVVVAAMLVAAAFSRSWVRRRTGARTVELALSPGPGAVAASADGARSRLAVLRRSVAAEVGLAVAVLAVTALLVNAVPGESAESEGGDGGPFSAEMSEDDIVLRVEVIPAAVGPVDIHLFVNGPDGAPLQPEEVRGDLALPARDLGPITVSFIDFGQGHYSADGAELPFAGDWELEVVVRTSDIDQTTFDVVVPVP